MLEQSLTDIVNKVSFLVNNSQTINEFPHKISFALKDTVKYPVTLTTEMIDKFITVEDDRRDILSHLYM